MKILSKNRWLPSWILFHITQQSLIALTKKWKSEVDSGKSFGALLTDLSKSFDCLHQELLLAKLKRLWLATICIKPYWHYPFNREQRTKINASYSSWEEILFGVTQGSILRPLLFNIFMFHLFTILE